MHLVDISAPGMEDQRDFMRGSAKKMEGQRNVLPPQIYNIEKYCGDYEDFDVANEDDELEEFLGIPRKTPKSVPATEKPAPAAEDSAPATETEAAPTDAEAAPTDAEAAPTEAEAAPTEAEAAPTEAKAPSTEPEVPNSEPEEKPEES